MLTANNFNELDDAQADLSLRLMHNHVDRCHDTAHVLIVLEVSRGMRFPTI